MQWVSRMNSPIALMEAELRSDCSSRYMRRAPSIRDGFKMVAPLGQRGVQPRGWFAVDEGESLQGCPGWLGLASLIASDAGDVDHGAAGDIGLGKSGLFSGLDEDLGVGADALSGLGPPVEGVNEWCV